MAKASINIDSDDSDDNPFAPQKSRAQQKKQAQEKSKAATTFIGYDASGRAFRRSQTPSVAATTTSRGTIAPRSNFARVKVRSTMCCTLTLNRVGLRVDHRRTMTPRIRRVSLAKPLKQKPLAVRSTVLKTQILMTMATSEVRTLTTS